MSKHFQLLAVIQTALAVAVAAFAAARFVRAPPPPPSATAEVETAPVERKRAETKRPDPSDQVAVARELLRGGDRFAAGRGRYAEILEPRTEGKVPRPLAAVLTCAEPEVNPELYLDRPLGDLYVVRTPGLTLDAASLGALEHAVSALGVEVLVVLGHERCGFLAAAASGEKPPSPNLKLLFEQLMPSLKPGFGRPLEDVVHLGMERQVAAATSALLQNSGLLRARADAQHLKILGAVVDAEHGALRTLDESGAWKAAEDDREGGLPLASLADADGGAPESPPEAREGAAAPKEAHEPTALGAAPANLDDVREREPRGAEEHTRAAQPEAEPARRGPPLVASHAPAADPSKGSAEAKSEATKSEATKTEATKTEATKSEATKSETAKSEATKTETAKSEATKSEAAKSEAAKSEAAKSEAAKSEAAKSEAAKSEAAKSEAATSDAAKLQPPTRDAARSEASKSEASKPGIGKASPPVTSSALLERVGPTARPVSAGPAVPNRRAAAPRERARPKLAEASEPPGVGMRAPALPEAEKPDAESVVRAALRAAMPAVEACYESVLRRHEQLHGKILVAVAVRSSGEVASSRIVESSLQNPEVLDCITGRLKRLHIPPPGEDVEITLPLTLVPRD